MKVIAKKPLGGTNGGLIAVTATSSAAPQKIHTVRGVREGWDEVELFVGNVGANNRDFSWRIGSSGPFQLMRVLGVTGTTAGDGRLAIPRLVMRGGVTVEVFSDAADELVVYGNVYEVKEVEDA